MPLAREFTAAVFILCLPVHYAATWHKPQSSELPPSPHSQVLMPESKVFAFVFGMASGHINPSLPLARRLVSQGHKVHYLSREQMRPAIEDTGATYWSEIEEEHELYHGREVDLMGAMLALKKEAGAESDPLMVGFMKVGPKSLELQLPGCIRWLQKINPSAVVYCPMLNQDAGYASHVLQLPSVALLTTAGPGSMALAMQFFLAGQDPKEVVEQARAHEPVLQSIRHIKDTYGIELDIFSGLETFGYLPILKKADLVMMTTTEDLQDPASPELMERYEKDGVSFVGVGPLLDQKGGQTCSWTQNLSTKLHPSHPRRRLTFSSKCMRQKRQGAR